MVDYWEKIAPYYDIGHEEEDIMDEINFLENAFKEIAQREIKTVLDVFCGTGVWSIPLANRGFTVIGRDKHKKMLEIARARESKDRLHRRRHKKPSRDEES